MARSTGVFASAAFALALLLQPSALAATTLTGTYVEVNYSDDGLAYRPDEAEGILAFVGPTPDWYDFTYYSSGSTTWDPFVASSFYYQRGGTAYEYAGYVQGTDAADYDVDWVTESETDISADGTIGVEYVWTVGDLEVTKRETWGTDDATIFVHFTVTNTSSSRVRNFKYMHLIDPHDTTSALNSTNTRNDTDDLDGDGVHEWAQAQGRLTATRTNNRTIAYGLCNPGSEQVGFKDGAEVLISEVEEVGLEADPGGSSSNFQLIYFHEEDPIEAGDTVMFGLVISTGSRDTDAQDAFALAQPQCWDLDGDGFESALGDGSDCDDSDADVNPDADETWYDGIDQDCGKDDDYDQDGDGYVPDEYEGLPTTDPGTGEDIDGTGELPGGDCDDTNEDINAEAGEDWYNGLDEDCAGDNDYDQDGDGYVEDEYVGEPTYDPSSGEVVDDGSGVDGGDCDDTDENIHEGAEEEWYNGLDEDCAGDSDFDQDGDGYTPDEYEGEPTYDPGSGEVVDEGELPAGDCDDTDETIYPGADEVWYDGIDGDCAGDNDYDQDGDGHVEDEYVGEPTYDPGSGEVVDDGESVDGGDCDDTNEDIYEGAEEEWYNGTDEDCAGDDDYDQDGDGYVPEEYEGEPTYDADGNEIPGTGDLPGGDCDDTDEDIGPGTEDTWYDGVDSDCAGDDDYDQDGDGYVEDQYEGEPTYEPDGDLVGGTGDAPGGDCDDTDANIGPGTDETWYDGVDSDCGGDDDYDQDGDGSVPDEYDGLVTYEPDGDPVDGTGDAPSGDCDDTDALVGPGADETWYDGTDSDCAGDDDYDADGDGHVPPEYDGLPTYSDSSHQDDPVPGTGELPADDCDDTDPEIWECEEIPFYKGGGGCACSAAPVDEPRFAGLAGLLGVLVGFWRRRRA